MAPSMHKQELMTPFSTRQYMCSEDFEVFYYSDLEPKAVSSHTHDYYEFYFFVEGDAEITISGIPHRIKPGDFLLIPPGTEHYPSRFYQKPYRRFILWISQKYCNQLLSASKDYVYLMQYVQTSHKYLFSNDLVTFHTMESKLFQIISEIKGKRFGREAYVSLAINELILLLNRIVYEKKEHVYDERQSLSSAIQLYIEEHLCEELTLDTLEHVFYVSKYYLSHAFKNDFGISIHQYIIKKRLNACRDAIVCKQPIVSTYETYGFKDYSSFYRAFKKEFGISPKECQEIQ